MNLAHAIMMMGVDDPLVLGQAYGGGYYAGQLNIGGLIYAIVVSPKATGESGTVLYRTTTTAFAGATSTNDGILIKNNMIAQGIAEFPGQQFCANLSIGGFTDWYMPTKDEMELAYRNLKPNATLNVTTSGTNSSAVPPTTSYTTTAPAQTALVSFRTSGAQVFIADYYSTATVGSAASQYWLKRMTTGADYSEGYAFTHYVRAFRRVRIG